MAETILSARGVSKSFYSHGRRVRAMESVDLDVREGEFLTIVGPSGCGKSTLLNLLVGLFPPTSGEVSLRGKPTRGINTHIGYVTQADNLLPWRTLRANVRFPLELRKEKTGDADARVDALIRQVGLAGFENHYPHELSGGMRQRVNIIRTLIYDPDVILMDEPFGPLDAQTRLRLQNQLLGLWEQHRKTIVFITHDLVEAITLADRVVVMTARPGRIKAEQRVEIPRPRDVFHIHRSDAFRDIYDRLWELLQAEVERSDV
ncbi:MAG: ABC transporter ATP-binding protein [Nitrospinota bacterium]